MGVLMYEWVVVVVQVVIVVVAAAIVLWRDVHGEGGSDCAGNHRPCLVRQLCLQDFDCLT